MNFLTLEVFGNVVRFTGGDLDGRSFLQGETVFIQGDTVSHYGKLPLIEALECGFWVLHRSRHRGHPSIICSYFNKRTQHIEERYVKILYSSGKYRCGPRFPKLIERYKDPVKEAA